MPFGYFLQEKGRVKGLNIRLQEQEEISCRTVNYGN